MSSRGLTNFYEETIDVIKNVGKTLDDVLYVYIEGKCCKPEKFFEKIKEIEYDSGYGLQEINSSLEIVFRNGSFLKRSEYDGSEWWSFVDVRPLDVELEEFPDDVEIKNSFEW